MKSLTTRTKLFLVFIAISIIPIIIVTINSYSSYTKIVNQQVSVVTSNTIENSLEKIDGIYQNIKRITLTFQQFSTIPGSPTVADQLYKLNNNKNAGPYDLYLARRDMQFFFNNLILSNDYINGIYLFLPDGKSITYTINNTDLHFGYVPLKDDWYKQTLHQKGGLYVSNVSTKPFIINAQPSVTFARAIYDFNTHKLLGVLMLDCDIKIFQALDNDIIPNMTNLSLVNNKGLILYDNTLSKIGKTLPKYYQGKLSSNHGGTNQEVKDGHLTVIAPFPDNNWNIVASIPMNELYKPYNLSEKLIIYISITCAVIFILLSLLLSNQLTRPTIELSKIMRTNKQLKKVSNDKYLNRKDEVGILYTEYNNMIEAIQKYIKESYQNKLITLDSQMKSLEAQINSHFLYNTLESINSIAEIEEIESISIMTKALGDMFRYSIKTESELVLLNDEIDHVKNYITIQNIRYDNSIDFNLEIPSKLSSCRILKLILQPIIENSILHGLEKKKMKGTVKIKAYEISQSRIVFEISDNGIGIERDKLSDIRNFLQEQPEFKELGKRSKESIGLKNVHSRIALYYGLEYGLNVESEPNKGTTIKICVPKIE
ncbi:sensor histidine kinase [Neobacillus sp. OS1-33]|jgi:two-component system sensor histidine kinase YesM|uniref:sensor histidine kinase n=1 Tax=Neobacillus sp. OS1-33 TaxID=3070683 RepID=UPI0027E00A2B|nr:sensor histidine kinase [Neobacillus sp. OS1-33]WML27301.1 sensor histidine kinase [Neobacillus sp. OS1-33]